MAMEYLLFKKHSDWVLRPLPDGRFSVPADSWDDDFEDKHDKIPTTRAGQGDQSAGSPTKELARNFDPCSPFPRTKARRILSRLGGTEQVRCSTASRTSSSGVVVAAVEEEGTEAKAPKFFLTLSKFTTASGCDTVEQETFCVVESTSYPFSQNETTSFVKLYWEHEDVDRATYASLLQFFPKPFPPELASPIPSARKQDRCIGIRLRVALVDRVKVQGTGLGLQVGQGREMTKRLLTNIRKLLKRKSAGFVQVRRMILPWAVTVDMRLIVQADTYHRQKDMPPRPPPVTPDGGRDRKISLLKMKTRQESEKDDMEDAGNVFIRSVRWIGLAGRHRMEKTGSEAKAPVDEAAEPKPVALSKTPTRKRSTVAAKLQHLQLCLGPQRWRRRQPSCLLLPPLEALIHLRTRDSVIRQVYLFTYQEERKSRQLKAAPRGSSLGDLKILLGLMLDSNETWVWLRLWFLCAWTALK
ncbi:hypothetical protein JOM56_005320 [Amanita muscaria]